MPFHSTSWDRLLDQRERRGFTGIVALQAFGESAYVRTCGWADRENKTPVTDDTAFDIGSITKTFTAAAILALEADGRLRVSDPLSEFFADAPADKRRITIQQLLTHTSGLADLLDEDGVPWSTYSVDDDYAPVSRNELLSRVWRSRLIGSEGKWSYSNVGFSLLAAIIEQRAGARYEEYLRERLLEPLGMRHTGYLLPRWSQVAVGSIDGKRWGRPTEKPWDREGPYWMLRGNGGLLSTAHDLRLWSRLFESDLLPSTSRRWLTTEHVAIAPGIANGCAWAIRAASEAQEPMIYHHGSNGVFSAALRWFPASQQVLVVLSSEANHAAHEIAKELWQSTP